MLHMVDYCYSADPEEFFYRSDWDLNLCLENECRRKQVKK